MRLREGLGLGQERPPPRPAATPATAPSGRNPEAPRELPQVCARNPGTGVREARAIALETSVRARAQAGREKKDLAKGLTAGGGVYPSPRPALLRGWTRAPPTSLGRSVSSSTRPARVLPHPLPLPLPHSCSPPAFVRRCSRRWEHPGISAAERQSGRRRPKSFYSWDDAGGRRRGDEALSQSRSGVSPERGEAGSFLAAGGGTGAGLFALLAHSPPSRVSGDASASGPHRSCQPWRQLLLRGQRRGCPFHGEW